MTKIFGYTPIKEGKTELAATDWLKLVLSFKYISNISIIVAVFAYWMNAYDVFFVCIPLVITNFVLFVLLSIYNLDEYTKGVLGRALPDIETNSSLLDSYKSQFILFNIIWHGVPLIWIYSILQRENLIQLFRPNFMSIFLKSVLVAIVYFYFERELEVYGKIDYLWYLIVYIIVLFASNIYLYLDR